jgi:hypothetical protein
MTTRQTIEQWTADQAMDLIQNYDRLGLRASGKFAKDLETKVEEQGTKWTITFLGSKHSQFMVAGRGANKNQDKDSIKAFVGWAGSTFLKQWVQDKGLNVSPFAVAYKIARKGINVPNSFNTGTLLSDVFTPEKLDELLRSISMTIIGDVRTDIKKLIEA